jgi:hypothetical protein
MKRAVIFLTLAAAFVVVPAIAVATAHRVHASVSVVSEKVRGPSVAFTLDVSFKVPKGASARAACTGKVRVSAKKSHWTGRLAAKRGVCDAHVKGTLPRSAEGAKVSFKVAFAGNSAVAPFSSAKKLVLTNPPVVGPPTFADGHWRSTTVPAFDFSVIGGVVKFAGVTGNSPVILQCVDDSNSQPASELFLWSYGRDVSLESGGHFADAYERTYSNPLSGTSWDLHLTFSGNLGQNGQGDIAWGVTGGSFTFLNPPPGASLSGCHGSFSAPVVKDG